MQHFEQQLAQFGEQLATMASHAETAVLKAVEAVTTRNDQLAREVRHNDIVLDQYEVALDHMAVELLAKAPLATDLRFIMVAMKVSHNLERIGDEATKIAKRAHELNQEPPLPLVADIPPLAAAAVDILHSALNAFMSRDPAPARDLVARDKMVDRMNRDIRAKLEAAMIESPTNVRRAVSLMVVAKSLERIADHGKNIAEEVVYLSEARDIRHSSPATPDN